MKLHMRFGTVVCTAVSRFSLILYDGFYVAIKVLNKAASLLNCAVIYRSVAILSSGPQGTPSHLHMQ